MPANRRKKERPLRISHCPQDCRAIIVEHKKRHPEEIDLHIKRGLPDDIRRRVHKAKRPTGQKKADHRHEDAAEKRQRDRRMYGFGHLLIVTGSIIAGAEHICPHGDSDKQIRKNVDQRRGGPHRRQGVAAAEVSHHDDIHRVEHELQDARRHQRQRKGNQLIHDGAIDHINFVFILLQVSFIPFH